MKYVCELCGTIYDEETGDVQQGIPAGTAYDRLPAHYDCPVCGSQKEAFCRQVGASKIDRSGHQEQAFWQYVKYSADRAESDR